MSDDPDGQEAWLSLFPYEMRARNVEMQIDSFIQDLMLCAGWRKAVIREPSDRPRTRRSCN